MHAIDSMPGRLQGDSEFAEFSESRRLRRSDSSVSAPAARSTSAPLRFIFRIAEPETPTAAATSFVDHATWSTATCATTDRAVVAARFRPPARTDASSAPVSSPSGRQLT
jgi:hypothetical protein